MAKTALNWPDYVEVSSHNILIRGNLGTDWVDAASFTLDEAEDLAQHLLIEVDKARRNSPEVKALTNLLEDVDANASWEDIALFLVENGYRNEG